MCNLFSMTQQLLTAGILSIRQKTKVNNHLSIGVTHGQQDDSQPLMVIYKGIIAKIYSYQNFSLSWMAENFSPTED